MEALFKEQLGDEFGYEWTSVAYQETQAGNTTTIVLVMALIVAFLVLAAQYESWTSPVAAVIGLPVALLGANDRLSGNGNSGQHLYSNRYYLACCAFCQEWYSDCGVARDFQPRVNSTVSRHLKPDTSGCVLS